jgi:hypothetical protein
MLGFYFDISNKTSTMFLPLLLLSNINPQIVCGKIVDGADKLPIHSAMIYTQKDTVYTNLDGTFQIPVSGEGFSIFGLGYQKSNISSPINGETILLNPLYPSQITIKKRK